jgi:hydroperoxy icosatetraenoate dehydratase/isomerase
MKLVYFFLNVGLPHAPENISEVLRIEQLVPKRKLKTATLQFGLNIRVPIGPEAQFAPVPSLVYELMRQLWRLPMIDYFQSFEPGANPVEWVMKRVGNMYPGMFDKWEDKLSDNALVRFCFNGIGAHRIESILDPTTKELKYYVFKTNALAPLSVRQGFETYGGDMYFTPDFRPAFCIFDNIREQDLATSKSGAGLQPKDVVRPGDKHWDYAKFCFRSSLLTIVTIADHLYGLHMFTANFMTTAIRECLSPDHPVRRFLSPFTYRTIAVNSNAMSMLIREKSLASRTFGFDKQSMSVATNAAPLLVQPTSQILAGSGFETMIDKAKGVDWLKAERKIDTPFFRQEKELYGIHHKFARDYLCEYYGGEAKYLENMAKDSELCDCFFEVIALSKNVNANWVPTASNTGSMEENLQGTITPAELAPLIEHMIASFMFEVTASHTQKGSVAVYAQDVSWTAGKWKPGEKCGTKQTALAQAMLLATTAAPMPLLMEPIRQSGQKDLVDALPNPTDLYETDDGSLGAGQVWDAWTYLFTAPVEAAKYTSCPGLNPADSLTGHDRIGAVGPKELYWKWMRALQKFSIGCDRYNTIQEMAKRPFPWNMPVYSYNPKFHDCSISV